MKTVTLILPLLLLQLLTPGCTSMAAEPRGFTVSLQAPDMAWSVRIEEIHKVNDELWVIAQLNRRSGMAGQMITTVKDTVKTAAPDDLKVKYFVLGKTWGWKNSEAYTFPKDRREIKEKLKSGTVLFQREDD
jgi:hypothetical protein